KSAERGREGDAHARCQEQVQRGERQYADDDRIHGGYQGAVGWSCTLFDRVKAADILDGGNRGGFIGRKAARVVQVQNLDVHSERDQNVAERDGRRRGPSLEIRRRHGDVVVEPELTGILEAEVGEHGADEYADE